MKEYLRDRFFSTDIGFRLSCALFLYLIASLAFTRGSSIPGQALTIEGDYLSVIFIAQIIIACIILLDVVINTMMPDTFSIGIVRRNRDIVYVTGGFCALVPAWYMSRSFGLSWVEGLLYLGAPILIFYLAFCDIKAKWEGQRIGALK